MRRIEIVDVPPFEPVHPNEPVRISRERAAERAAVREALADGTLRLSEALNLAVMGPAPVGQLIRSVKGVGPAGVRDALRLALIPADRKVQGLGYRQRETLHRLFG